MKDLLQTRTGGVTKRSLVYVLCFAATGFLLTLWQELSNFAPVRSFFARGILEFACLGWPGVVLGRWYLEPFLLRAPVNAAVYAALGWLAGRALRRLPPRAQDPHGYQVTKRVIVCFAVVGFTIAAWWYLFMFEPLYRWWLLGDELLYCVCVSCKSGHGAGTPSLGMLLWLLLFWGPANASFFGMIGWVVGRAFRRLPPTEAVTTPSPATGGQR
jgi:hypothetical protein